jgi:hypothetical protein
LLDIRERLIGEILARRLMIGVELTAARRRRRFSP